MSTGDDRPGWAAPGSASPPPGWSDAQPPPTWAPPPTYQAWTPPAPRPGIVPLRPLSVGELLDGAFTAMRRYPRVTLGLAAIIATTQQLLGLVVDLSTGNITGPSGTFSPFRTVSGLLSVVITTLLSTVLAGMLTLVIGDAVLGRDVTVATVWGRLRPMFWRLLGAAFIATVLTYLGLIACGIGFFFTWVTFGFTTPALLLERLRVTDAVRRSWRLTIPAFWRLLGIRLLATLLAAVIASIITIPAAIITVTAAVHSFDTGSTVAPGLGAELAIRLSSLVATTLTAPFTTGVLALLYIDRRMRSEALDLALVRAAGQTTTA